MTKLLRVFRRNSAYHNNFHKDKGYMIFHYCNRFHSNYIYTQSVIIFQKTSKRNIQITKKVLRKIP